MIAQSGAKRSSERSLSSVSNTHRSSRPSRAAERVRLLPAEHHAAVDDARVGTELDEQMADECGGRGFAGGAGDGEEFFSGDKFREQFGAMPHRHTEFFCRCQIGIIRLDSGADHDGRSLRGDAGAVLRKKFRARAPQRLQHAKIFAALVEEAIGAGDDMSRIDERLRKRAHADAGNADEVEMGGGRW